MKRISANSVGIQQGNLLLFSHYIDGGPMWEGSGERELRSLVTFAETFMDAPHVYLSISMWDTDHRTNLRADVVTADVTASNFAVVFRTWGDTRIARVRVDWLAIGRASDPEDWQLY